MANQPNNSTTTLILDGADSYGRWIKEVEKRAVDGKVWIYLDPEATNKPVLEELEYPQPEEYATEATIQRARGRRQAGALS